MKLNTKIIFLFFISSVLFSSGFFNFLNLDFCWDVVLWVFFFSFFWDFAVTCVDLFSLVCSWKTPTARWHWHCAFFHCLLPHSSNPAQLLQVRERIWTADLAVLFWAASTGSSHEGSVNRRPLELVTCLTSDALNFYCRYFRNWIHYASSLGTNSEDNRAYPLLTKQLTPGLQVII